MPAAEPVATIDELMGAFHAAIGIDNALSDASEGSMYDHWGSGGGLAFKRLIEHGQSEFRAIYFDTAPGTRLDTYSDRHFHVARTFDTFGVGTVACTRPAGPGTDGRFFDGTRIAVGGGTTEPLLYYVIDGDQDVGSARTTALNIRATVPGPLGAIVVTSDIPVLRFEDVLTDPSWSIDALACGPGTVYQKDADFRSAIREIRSNQRPGYPIAITDAMKNAGAEIVALFESSYLGDALDAGLNRIYVGTTSYETTPELLTSCRLAVPACAVGGTGVQVLAMTNQLFYLDVTVRLWAPPSRFNSVQAQASGADSVVEYFATRENPFVWRYSGIRAAIMRAVPNVHNIDILSWYIDPATGAKIFVQEPVLLTLFDSGVLTRWQIEPWTVHLTVVGPT